MLTFIGLIQLVLTIMGIIMFWNISPWWSITVLALLMLQFGWAICEAFRKED